MPNRFSIKGTDIGSGDIVEFSESCNADFVSPDTNVDCDWYANYGFCDDANDVWELVRNANKNSAGIWETALSCPQCGCGANGALNLNDLYEVYEASLTG